MPGPAATVCFGDAPISVGLFWWIFPWWLIQKGIPVKSCKCMPEGRLRRESQLGLLAPTVSFLTRTFYRPAVVFTAPLRHCVMLRLAFHRLFLEMLFPFSGFCFAPHSRNANDNKLSSIRSILFSYLWGVFLVRVCLQMFKYFIFWWCFYFHPPTIEKVLLLY
jgi:hypothetical protein